MQSDGYRHQLYLEFFFEILSSKLLEMRISKIQKCKFSVLPVAMKFEATVTILDLPEHHTKTYTFCKL